MATTPQVIAVLSVLLQMHPSTLDRYIRELRAAGILPTGKRGGGKDALHYTPYHLVMILLSTAATGPGGAVEAAQKLSALRPARNSWQGVWENLEKHFQVSSHTLAEFLALLVEKYGQGNAEAAYLDHSATGHQQKELTLCLDRLSAWISEAANEKDGQGDKFRIYWKPTEEGDRGIPARRILVSFPFEVLRILGELCSNGSDELDLSPQSKTPEQGVTSTPAPASAIDQSSGIHHPSGAHSSSDVSACVCEGQPLPLPRLVARVPVVGARDLQTERLSRGGPAPPRSASCRP